MLPGSHPPEPAQASRSLEPIREAPSNRTTPGQRHEARSGRILALAPCAALVVFTVCSVAPAQTNDTVSILVDSTVAGSPLRPIWAYYGYDELNYTTTAEGMELLNKLANIQQTPVHVRTHFLFNTGDGTAALKWGSTNVYTEDDAGNPIYDFSILDSIMDATVDAGTFPLVELGFMPQALSRQPDPYRNSNPYTLDGGCFHPPDDYDKWAALITAWVRHVEGRYRASEPQWQWELWNEPDIGYWRGSFDEYAELYDTTEAALHAVLPDASLGGPAVANPANDFLGRFLEHCATGTNAVTGQRGTRLDMVSFHAKGGVSITNGHVQMDLGNQLRLHRAGFETVAASAFARTPIVISEADPDGCAACPATVAPQHAYRNTPAYGAYEVAMMKRSLDLADELGVDLRGVLTWAFTFPDSAYFEGYRALTTHGVDLPVLNAFKLLGGLTGDRLPVASSGAMPLSELIERGVREEPDVDALATIDGDRIQILVWNYHDDLLDVPATTVTLDVRVGSVFGATADVAQTRVDDAHGNAFAVWHSQGAPEQPSASQRAALQMAMVPSQQPERRVDVDSGTLSIDFELPRHGIALFTISPGDDGDDQNDMASDRAGCACEVGAPAHSHHAPRFAWPLTALAIGYRCRTGKKTNGRLRRHRNR